MQKWVKRLVSTSAALGVLTVGVVTAYYFTNIHDPYVEIPPEKVFALQELPVYKVKNPEDSRANWMGTLQIADKATVVGRNSKKDKKTYWYKIEFDGGDGWVHSGFGDTDTRYARNYLKSFDSPGAAEVYTRKLAASKGASEDFWLDALKSYDKELRRIAVSKLADTKSERFVKPLSDLLFTEKDEYVITTIYYAMGYIGGQEAIDVMENYYDFKNGDVVAADGIGTNFNSSLAYAARTREEAHDVYNFLARETLQFKNPDDPSIWFWAGGRGRAISEAQRILERTWNDLGE